MFKRIQTYFILKAYGKATLQQQAELRKKELTRIAGDRYNMEAYYRLSLMSPKKTQACGNALSALGASYRQIMSRLNQLKTSHPSVAEALLRPGKAYA